MSLLAKMKICNNKSSALWQRLSAKKIGEAVSQNGLQSKCAPNNHIFQATFTKVFSTKQDDLMKCFCGLIEYFWKHAYTNCRKTFSYIGKHLKAFFEKNMSKKLHTYIYDWEAPCMNRYQTARHLKSLGLWLVAPGSVVGPLTWPWPRFWRGLHHVRLHPRTRMPSLGSASQRQRQRRRQAQRQKNKKRKHTCTSGDRMSTLWSTRQYLAHQNANNAQFTF